MAKIDWHHNSISNQYQISAYTNPKQFTIISGNHSYLAAYKCNKNNYILPINL